MIPNLNRYFTPQDVIVNVETNGKNKSFVFNPKDFALEDGIDYFFTKFELHPKNVVSMNVENDENPLLKTDFPNAKDKTKNAIVSIVIDDKIVLKESKRLFSQERQRQWFSVFNNFVRFEFKEDRLCNIVLVLYASGFLNNLCDPLKRATIRKAVDAYKQENKHENKIENEMESQELEDILFYYC